MGASASLELPKMTHLRLGAATADIIGRTWRAQFVLGPLFMRQQLATVFLLATLSGCATMNRSPIHTVDHVDIGKFMGSWYVIGSIPTFFEKNAYNAVESYEQNPDGTIKTTFTYHKGSFDGPVKNMHPTGFIRDASNAVWGMRILWPFKSEYLIAYLSSDYSQTIIARNARDHIWIMAKTPTIADADYKGLVERAGAMGYDVARIERVPQRWP
jgi:apolipoprotein D and lipocalin family protein